jgi:hypothetical protein
MPSSIVPGPHWDPPVGVQTPSTFFVPGPHSLPLSPQPITAVDAVTAKTSASFMVAHYLEVHRFRQFLTNETGGI